MPTGYTQPLYDGEPITFAQFVLRCSRAMGAAIMQRDESLDAEIQLREVSDYSIRAVEKSGAALTEAWGRPDEAWAELQDEAIAEAEKYRSEYVTKRDAMRERYESMLEQVRAWTPPTAEHEGLRKFMVEQIEESLRFDVDGYEPSVPDRLPVAEYREREIGRLARALERDTKALQEERDRVRGQNAWVTALRDSLTITA
jgi:hypothetical protein